jgi:hypothetical protein
MPLEATGARGGARERIKGGDRFWGPSPSPHPHPDHGHNAPEIGEYDHVPLA